MTARYEQGTAAAQQAIAIGRLRFFSGAPSRTKWAADLAETLRLRFEIEVEFHGDMSTEGERAFWKAYNATIKAHIDGRFGRGSLARAEEEVEDRRKERYDAYFSKLKPSQP